MELADAVGFGQFVHQLVEAVDQFANLGGSAYAFVVGGHHGWDTLFFG
jgi:hypothetical protein